MIQPDSSRPRRAPLSLGSIRTPRSPLEDTLILMRRVDDFSMLVGTTESGS